MSEINVYEKMKRSILETRLTISCKYFSLFRNLLFYSTMDIWAALIWTHLADHLYCSYSSAPHQLLSFFN